MICSADIDFDYLLAALAARLMFISTEKTPIYFPETVDEAEALIRKTVESYNPGCNITHFIVVPSYNNERASLGVIYSLNGNTIAARFSGKGIYDLLSRGENL
jgi:hypothetical protein